MDIAALRQGSPRAIARMLTKVENGTLDYTKWWPEMFPYLGSAFVVGITGWPGVGKSTLLGRLLEHAAHNTAERVGVIAVDPSSQVSGGAVLADRLRMMSTALNPNVFVRSLASRGAQTGVSATTLGAVDVMDVAGFHWVFIETVGVGQTQVDILEMADVVVLVTAPGLGDEVQAIKAGILEIPDAIVINMADRPGTQRTMTGLRWALRQGHDTGPDILSTVASEDIGIDTVWNRLHDLRTRAAGPTLAEHRRLRNRRRAFAVVEELWREALRQAAEESQISTLLAGTAEGRNDPSYVGQALIRRAAQHILALVPEKGVRY